MRIRLDFLRTSRKDNKTYRQSVQFDTAAAGADAETASVATAIVWINEHLSDIRDTDNNSVEEIAWACGCLQKRCGTCAMVIGGKPRLACDARLAEFEKQGSVTVEPLKKFPVVADLVVDRSAMFAHLRRMHAEAADAEPRTTEAAEHHVSWEAAVSGETASGQSADMQSADGQSAAGRSTDMQSEDTQSANMQSADTQNADGQSTDLQSADGKNANMQSADTHSADFRDTDSVAKKAVLYAPLQGRKRQLVYESSRCLQCGCCLEVCPNFAVGDVFFGTAAAIPAGRNMVLAGNGRPPKQRKTDEGAADRTTGSRRGSGGAQSADTIKRLRNSYRKHVYEGCGKSLSCRTICPAGIDVDNLLLHNAAMAVWGRRLRD